MNEECIIADTLRIVDALRILNDLSDTAMTLFVVDNNGCMVGTLTDGDIRRALIGNYELDSRVRDVMFCEFAYIDENDLNIVSHIHELRNKHIKLIPVLDSEHHIKEIYNIEKLRSVLPIDVVMMAGGKGERLRPLTEKTPIMRMLSRTGQQKSCTGRIFGLPQKISGSSTISRRLVIWIMWYATAEKKEKITATAHLRTRSIPF